MRLALLLGDRHMAAQALATYSDDWPAQVSKPARSRRRDSDE